MGAKEKVKQKGHNAQSSSRNDPRAQSFPDAQPLLDENTIYVKLTPEDKQLMNENLRHALYNYDPDNIKLYLKLGAKADINIQDVDGWTALIRAVRDWHTDLCKLLVDHGANVNIQDKMKRTALMWAARNEYIDIYELLIEHGANVNLQDNDRETALMLAVIMGCTDTIGYLLSVGANPLLKNKNGMTAYDFERRKEIKQIIKVYENLWKRLGEKQTQILVQNINPAIRNCSPDTMREIIVNL